MLPSRVLDLLNMHHLLLSRCMIQEDRICADSLMSRFASRCGLLVV